MTQSKPLWKSKTAIFNAIIATLAVIEVADLSIIPNGYGQYITLAAAIGNIWLRMITSQPVSMS